MGDGSGIEWTDATWNPTTGCTKVSPGCTNCYAERMSKRLAGRGGYPADEPFRLTLHPDRLSIPYRWSRPRMIFVDSMSDLFHEDVPASFIAAVFGAMAAAPRHTFQILTKRPERAYAWFEWLERETAIMQAKFHDMPGREGVLSAALVTHVENPAELPTPYPHHLPGLQWPLPNVWLGTSVEAQRYGEDRIPYLLACPASVRFLSCEPLLGPVDLAAVRMTLPPGAPVLPDGDSTVAMNPLRRRSVFAPHVHWVIGGGESGPGARPCAADWARLLRDRCIEAGVPFFWKQWGEWMPAMQEPPDGSFVPTPDDELREVQPGEPRLGADRLIYSWRVGKHRAGAHLDGRLWRQMPERAPAVTPA